MSVKLQPLRIPTGWKVEFNDGFFEIDPIPKAIPEQHYRTFFKEDMLLMTHSSRHRTLDLGWYPEGDLEVGQFVLELHEGDYSGRQVYRLATRDRAALITAIERILQAVCDGHPEFGPYPK